MKIYSVPDAVPTPQPNYRDYNRDVEDAKERAHMEALKKHLIGMGFKGKNTGRIYRAQVADGYAQYMVADAGNAKQSALIHLEYGDAYQDRNAQHLSMRVILDYIAADERMSALFK